MVQLANWQCRGDGENLIGNSRVLMGVPCLAASQERLRESLLLDLPPQLQDTQAPLQPLLHQHPLLLLRQAHALHHAL